MQMAGKVLPYAIGGLLGGTLLKKMFKKPKVTPQPGPPTRDEAREEALKRDALARRRGGAADMVSGPYGGEPASSSIGKTSLGD